MYISTISIAEYCVLGSIDHLPLATLKIVPFNTDHAIRAGAFAALTFKSKKTGGLLVSLRRVIPNDTKLFAQADVEPDIKYYLSSDSDSLKIYQNLISLAPKFNFIDLNNSYQTSFGVFI